MMRPSQEILIPGTPSITHYAQQQTMIQMGQIAGMPGYPFWPVIPTSYGMVPQMMPTGMLPNQIPIPQPERATHSEGRDSMLCQTSTPASPSTSQPLKQNVTPTSAKLENK